MLPEPDVRIHFTLTNASKSSPALKCYSPDDIHGELEAAACAFFLDGGLHVNMDTKIVSIDKMIDWYVKFCSSIFLLNNHYIFLCLYFESSGSDRFSIDFGKNEAEILTTLIRYLEPSTVDNVLELLDGNQFKILYRTYDWSANS